ncbi:MAG: hypothetical protein HC781_17335 [Leptolyngbyaceae cyanobacterium CSU_1_4]|nr:hypothetical protein [Leptolyngbyaceae cyanobacterium CSU_1_4]
MGLCLWAGLWVSFSSFTHASFAQISEPSATLCAPHNFEQQADVIILGKLPNASYVVIVPLNGNTELLSEVRQCVADAFQTESRLGKYIQAGAFAQRSAAHQLTRQLYSLGLDARTIYSP